MDEILINWENLANIFNTEAIASEIISFAVKIENLISYESIFVSQSSGEGLLFFF